MKNVFFWGGLFLIIFQSCIGKDCIMQEIAPSSFAFNLCNATTGKNIFEENNSLSDITIKEVATNTNIFFSKSTINGAINIIVNGSIARNRDAIELQLMFKNKLLFTYKVSVEKIEKDCYQLTEYNHHDFGSNRYEVEENGGFKVFVDL